MCHAINILISTCLNFMVYTFYRFINTAVDIVIKYSISCLECYICQKRAHLLKSKGHINLKTVIIKISLAGSSFGRNHFCPVAALYMSEKGTFHQEMHLCHCSDTFTIHDTGKCVFKENKTNQGDKCKTCSPLNYNIFKQLVGNINHLLEAIINCINLYIRKGSFYRHLHC